MDNQTALDLAQAVLAHLGRYLERGDRGAWPGDFGRYLESLQDEGGELRNGESESDPIGLGVTLVSLSNLVRRRAARALRESPFATIMDYQFLFVLASHGPMSKGSLIDANGMETSSGTEVIKRLYREGWIAEEPHPTDGRSIVVRLTEEGEKTEAANRPAVAEYYISLSEPLEGRERAQLLELAHSLATAR